MPRAVAQKARRSFPLSFPSMSARVFRLALPGLLLLLLAPLAACGSTEAVEGQEETKIEVENQGFNRAVIYVLRGTRFRLGAVEGRNTDTFTIPPSFISGITTLRFIAEPLGGRAEVSQEITVTPGDTVSLTILP